MEREAKIKMKLFLLVFLNFVFVTSQFTEQQKFLFDRDHADCANATGVDIDFILKGMNGIFIPDEKYKNHLLCYSQKFGFQDKDGILQMDVIETILGNCFDDPEVIADTMKNCLVQGDDPRDIAFDILECIHHVIHND